MTQAKKWILVAATALLASSAYAQKAGDWVIGAGALRYAPQDKSQPLAFVEPMQRVVPGSGADLQSATTLGLNVHYFLTDNWAIEGVLGVPPKLKLNGAGSLEAVGELGKARLYAPSLLGKYFFGNADDRLRISLGLGVTYSQFRSVKLSNGLQGTLNSAIGLPPGASRTTAKIDSQWAPVLNVGANYAIDKNWGVTFSVSYVPMKTDAVLTTTVNGSKVAVSKTRLTLDPLIPFLYVTYKF